ncbi:MAG: cytochrome c-type biogenesis CcmF C-terminal domain-containing protein [Aggregatilineales bacterium]
MLAEIGFATTLLAFIAALYAIFAVIYGERVIHNEAFVLSGRNAAIWVAILLTIATTALTVALMTEQYQITYVWSVSSPDMPPLFRFTALWGSQAGSLLFWSFLMALFAAATLILNWRSQRRLMPYATAFMMGTLVFFIGLVLFFENPFTRWWIAPNGDVVQSVLPPSGAIAPGAVQLAQSANGLNPLLRHFGMAIHPPMLYLGFVSFMIPFAYAMSALASGDLTTNWIKVSRRWMLIAWLTLSLGLILGGRWAYDVLGWGGYWGWDPVENAALLPWLIGTALLHSVMIQEKRGMLKSWNMFLVILTFSAVIFGTFATRSGLVESVHSFARSEIGFPMFAFWFIMTFISFALLVWRRGRGELHDEHRFGGLLSRETLFVLNNIVFIVLFVAVFWGSFGAPIVSELFMNTKITLGQDYFHLVTPPLFAAMFVLMGVAPLSAWSTTSLARMGRAFIAPLALTALSLAGFALMGMRDAGALLGYGIVTFAGWVGIVETVRGIRARQCAHSETLPAALGALFQRNPRRYGGYLIHLGITVIGIGVIGSTLFQMETQQTLAVGEQLELGGYTMTYDGLLRNQVAEDGRLMDIALVTINRDGHEIAQLRPRRDFFPQTQGINTMTIAGAHSTLENDFYVLLIHWEPIAQNAATFKVYVNPLVNLIWWGSLLLIAGTFLAAFPRDAVGERVLKPIRVSSAAEGLAAKGA